MARSRQHGGWRRSRKSNWLNIGSCNSRAWSLICEGNISSNENVMRDEFKSVCCCFITSSLATGFGPSETAVSP